MEMETHDGSGCYDVLLGPFLMLQKQRSLSILALVCIVRLDETNGTQTMLQTQFLVVPKCLIAST